MSSPSSPYQLASSKTSQLPAKRKRESSVPPTPPPSSSPTMRYNYSIPGAVLVTSASDEDRRSRSPRTKVAYSFQGLQLEDGGAVSKMDLQQFDTPKLIPRANSDASNESAVRKRLNMLGGNGKGQKEQRNEIPETPARESFKVVIGSERRVSPTLKEKAQKVVLHNEVDPVIFKGSPVGNLKGDGLARSYPSINRLADSKSKGTLPRKRVGLFGSAEASLELKDRDNDEGYSNLDPGRAASTWRDDEITGYNPSDPEDDGEGMNGIGFKPTAAMAYDRSQKRRAQMAEYRNREAKEERARRSERRRGNEMSDKNRDEMEAARRVRFMENTLESVIPPK